MLMLIEEKRWRGAGRMLEAIWWGGRSETSPRSRSSSAPSPALAPVPLEYAPSRLCLLEIAVSFDFDWWMEWGSALLWLRWDRMSACPARCLTLVSSIDGLTYLACLQKQARRCSTCNSQPKCQLYRCIEGTEPLQFLVARLTRQGLRLK